jgi:retinol dehydrogenase-12
MGLKNKICVITGATAGIGKETAKQIATQNYDIYIVARNKERCIATIEELKIINNNNHYDYFIADFEQLEQVRKTALEIKNALPIIDVLVNNAGAVYSNRELTVEDFEKTFAVNHLAPFLLTNILLDNLKNSTQGRIVTVASDSHFAGKIDFDDMNLDKRYFILKAYERSKLANVLFSNHLAKILSNTKVTSNSVQPGRVNSEIGSKNTGFFYNQIWNIVDFLTGIPTADGAKTSVYLATSAEVATVSGKYFDKCKSKMPSKLAQDEKLAEQLWQKSLSMLKMA